MAPENQNNGASQAPPPRPSVQFWKVFFIFLMAAVSVLFIYLVRRFIMPVFMATITAGLFYPWYKRMRQRLSGRNTLAAAILTLIVICLVLVPAGGIGYYVVNDLIRIGTHFTQNIAAIHSQLQAVVSSLEKLPLFKNLDLSGFIQTSQIATSIREIGTFLLKTVAQLAKDVLKIVLFIFIYIYCLFFFFRDGDNLLHRIFRAIPMPREDKDTIIGRFVAVTRAMIKNTLIIGAIQGFIGGSAFFLLGLKGAVFWGILIMFFSAIPNVGAAIIWVPAAIYLLLIGRITDGIVLFAVGVTLIGSVDYVLRPHLIGEELQVHKILILFGVLGGIALFGVFGIIIGPIIMSAFVSLWNIYIRVFRTELENIRS